MIYNRSYKDKEGRHDPAQPQSPNRFYPDDRSRQIMLETIDFLLALGELFALVVYAQLILENTWVYKEDVNDDLLEQIFDCLVRDFSKHALQLYSKPSSSGWQMELCLRMLRRPVVDAGRFDRVWEQVQALRDAYELS